MKLPKDYVPGVGVVKPTGGYGGFGQKMLEKMGWAEGQGLGKEKHGMKAALEVQKKEDTLGVSASPSGVCLSAAAMLLAAAHRACVQHPTCCICVNAPLQYALFASRASPLRAAVCTHTFTHPIGGRQAVHLAVGLEVLGGCIQQRSQVHKVPQQQRLHLL